MANDIAVRADMLGKFYTLGQRRAYRTLRETISEVTLASVHRVRRLVQRSAPAGRGVSGREVLWALRGVSFEVRVGEVVGIIGRNGAGKSTLLKILSRITEPTEGWVDLGGRVGSLLEVGTGFHPELTGRENIYLNGAILGMKRREISRNFDAIVSFAEVEKFLDTPVKYYSSGMYVRLAFAVAAHLEPEVLLVDEVLAVGDAAFQRKCMGKMSEVAAGGRTVLFVSHNMAAIQNLCQRCLLLEAGCLAAEGPPKDLVVRYLTGTAAHRPVELADRKDRKGSGLVRFTGISFESGQGDKTPVFLSGQDVVVRLGYETARPVSDGAAMLVGLAIKDMLGTSLFLCTNQLTGEIEEAWPKRGSVRCRIPRLPLLGGSYSVNIYVAVNGEPADWITDAATFAVESGDFYGTGRCPPVSHGPFLVAHNWSVGDEGLSGQAGEA